MSLGRRGEERRGSPCVRIFAGLECHSPGQFTEACKSLVPPSSTYPSGHPRGRAIGQLPFPTLGVLDLVSPLLPPPGRTPHSQLSCHFPGLAWREQECVADKQTKNPHSSTEAFLWLGSGWCSQVCLLPTSRALRPATSLQASGSANTAPLPLT